MFLRSTLKKFFFHALFKKDNWSKILNKTISKSNTLNKSIKTFFDIKITVCIKAVMRAFTFLQLLKCSLMHISGESQEQFHKINKTLMQKQKLIKSMVEENITD